MKTIDWAYIKAHWQYWLIVGALLALMAWVMTGCAAENQLGFQPFGNAKIEGKADIGDKMEKSTKMQNSPISTNTGTQITWAEDNLDVILASFAALLFAVLWLYGRFDRFQDDLTKTKSERDTLKGYVERMKEQT